MSAVGDIFGAIRQVILLDDRVGRIETDIGAVQNKLESMDRRVTRLEGIIEMAMHGARGRIDRD